MRSLFIGIAGLSIPSSLLAVGIAWVADRLYTMGIWPLGAVLRVVNMLIQLGVLLGAVFACIALVLLFIQLIRELFKPDLSQEERKEAKRTYWLSIIGIICAGLIANILVPLLENWLNFNEKGLGLIELAYLIIYYVFGWGSVLAAIVWLGFLPKAILIKTR